MESSADGADLQLPRARCLARKVSRQGERSADRSVRLRLRTVRLCRGSDSSQGGDGDEEFDHDKIAKYIHANKFPTVAGELAFGKDGELAEPRTVFTQFQDVQTNDVAQFRDGKKQPILWPDKFKTGTMLYPYLAPKP